MAIREGRSYKDRPINEKTIAERAFERALDIELMIVDRMEDLGMRKKDLADKMGVSPSGLSNFLNTQPNMTLETMMRFEVALDAVFDITLKPLESYDYVIGLPEPQLGRTAQVETSFEGQFAETRDYRFDFGQREAMQFQRECVVNESSMPNKKELRVA